MGSDDFCSLPPQMSR